MRGVKLSKRSRKLDVVVDSVRYDDDQMIQIVRAYERRGKVWGDLVLLDRNLLAARIEDKKEVVTGRQLDIPGDFDVFHKVESHTSSGQTYLFAGEMNEDSDSLNLPIF